MHAASQKIKTSVSDELGKLLSRRLSVKTVLSLINGTSQFNVEEFLRKINNLPLQRKLTETETYRRSKPLANKYDAYPPVTIQFQQYYSQHNFATSTLEIHMRNLRGFILFLAKAFTQHRPFSTLQDMRRLTKNMITAYEEHLVDKLNNGEIQRSTVYKYLVTLRMFLKLLSKESIIKINYIIPESLIDHGKRSNDYVEVQQINALLDTLVMSKNRQKIRDMAVILLVMELGCRPIEVTNIKLTDLKITERQITIYCRKSGFRNLKISRDLCDVLRKYTLLRSTLNINHEYLFSNAYGEPLTRSALLTIFQRANMRAFGELRFNPKALRHTYATNALDNENDFDEVSASMGHKHRCSTEWYIHRSIQRMLKRTMPHNPVNGITNEE